MRRLPALFVLLAAVTPVPSGAGLPEGLDAVRPEAIEAHMAYLAHDLLEGRETGTRGYELAARYVATQFQVLGLEPAGEEGYLQWIDFRRTDQVEEGCRAELHGDGRHEALVYARDYLMSGDPMREQAELEAPLVFVGYGVSAPEAGYDDYAGIDVSGKIVVVLRGAPPTFDHNQRAYYSSKLVKNETAVAHGAVGMFSFRKPREAAKRPWERSVINSKISSMRWMNNAGEVHGVFPELRMGLVLSPEGVERLFTASPVPLEEAMEAMESGEPRSFEFGWTGSFTMESRHAEVRSPNVAGLLRGSDPTLRHEVVVFSGHLDHLGVGEPVDGDRIYNGAYDNASGIAVLLEAARVLTGMEERPRRSILFLAVAGEEKGLLGSEYFCTHPTVPMKDVVGNVNLDMFLMLGPLEDVIAFGAEHSSFQGIVERAASRVGVATSPDPMPEEVIFVRSDQFSFVRKGVPAVFLVAGGRGAVPSGGVDATGWMRDVYHTQRDDMTQHFDWEAARRFTQINLLIGLDVANADERPRWNAGDFFGDRFAPGR